MKNDDIDRSVTLITTDDGSHSLYVPALNETYHSFHGAIQESEYVFINMGLEFCKSASPHLQTIEVLEIGLGTGLNVLLTAKWAFVNKVQVNMTSLEAFPIDEEIINELNYTEFIDHEFAKEWFRLIHSISWNKQYDIHPYFSLLKADTKIETYSLPDQKYEVVYFDAFAPNKQAELWELDILEKVFKSQVQAGVFVTYCAKGQLKRDLFQIGYEVETLPGPPGKKEMVRGKVLPS